MNIRKYGALWAVTAVMTVFSSCGQADMAGDGTAENSQSGTLAFTEKEALDKHTEKETQKTVSVKYDWYEGYSITLTSPTNEELLGLADYSGSISLHLLLPLPEDTDLSLLSSIDSLEELIIGFGDGESCTAGDRLSEIYLPGLRSLSLEDCGPCNALSISESFPGLEYLHISGCPVDEAYALGYVKGLKSLYIDGCGIDNIDFARLLPGMEKFYAENNNIADISPLAGMTSLKKLDISGNPIGGRAGETLMSLSGLTVLAANDCGISDLGFLTGCPGLEQLYLDNNPICDITPLCGHEMLSVLSICHARIENIEALQELYRLSLAALEDNNITDISPLSGCCEECSIDVHGNPISQEDMDNFFEDNPGMRLWAPG